MNGMQKHITFSSCQDHSRKELVVSNPFPGRLCAFNHLMTGSHSTRFLQDCIFRQGESCTCYMSACLAAVIGYNASIRWKINQRPSMTASLDSKTGSKFRLLCSFKLFSFYLWDSESAWHFRIKICLCVFAFSCPKLCNPSKLVFNHLPSSPVVKTLLWLKQCLLEAVWSLVFSHLGNYIVHIPLRRKQKQWTKDRCTDPENTDTQHSLKLAVEFSFYFTPQGCHSHAMPQTRRAKRTVHKQQTNNIQHGLPAPPSHPQYHYQHPTWPALGRKENKQEMVLPSPLILLYDSIASGWSFSMEYKITNSWKLKAEISQNQVKKSKSTPFSWETTVASRSLSKTSILEAKLQYIWRSAMVTRKKRRWCLKCLEEMGNLVLNLVLQVDHCPVK